MFHECQDSMFEEIMCSVVDACVSALCCRCICVRLVCVDRGSATMGCLASH